MLESSGPSALTMVLFRCRAPAPQYTGSLPVKPPALRCYNLTFSALTDVRVAGTASGPGFVVFALIAVSEVYYQGLFLTLI